jgi:O-acetyl-ADP-ribose deacetylase (regulator of RNase III)
MVKIERGKTIFESTAQTLVNTINCVGVMGKGLALEFKNRYPAMFDKYKSFCDKGVFKPGVLWIYKADDGKWVLNFPTKIDWRNPSKIEYLEEGLKKFVEIWKEKGITSIAFPLLGCTNGGLDPDVVIPLMEKYLNKCEGLDVTIYDDREPIIEEVKLPSPEELVSENINPVEVVAESAPLVDEEPVKEQDENPAVVQVEESKENDEEPVKVKVQLNSSIDKVEQEIKVTPDGKTLPIVVPEPKLTEEQEILNEIIEERKAINQEVDKVLNQFANAENTPELRKEVTKQLYNVINRRGFPAGSVFQI